MRKGALRFRRGFFMRTIGTLVGLVTCLALALPAVAHHSFDTEYDATKKVKFTGVVTNVAWTNPHMRVYIDVTDASGNTSQFSTAVLV